MAFDKFVALEDGFGELETNDGLHYHQHRRKDALLLDSCPSAVQVPGNPSHPNSGSLLRGLDDPPMKPLSYNGGTSSRLEGSQLHSRLKRLPSRSVSFINTMPEMNPPTPERSHGSSSSKGGICSNRIIRRAPLTDLVSGITTRNSDRLGNYGSSGDSFSNVRPSGRSLPGKGADLHHQGLQPSGNLYREPSGPSSHFSSASNFSPSPIMMSYDDYAPGNNSCRSDASGSRRRGFTSGSPLPQLLPDVIASKRGTDSPLAKVQAVWHAVMSSTEEFVHQPSNKIRMPFGVS